MGDAARTAQVLVVDDEERNRRLLLAMLEAEGHVGMEAAGGAQALQLARLSPPDLILLDIMMPGMDGFEVVRALKADAATKAIPVVMVTALDDREARLKGLEAGAEEFVTKPVDRSELRIRVRNLLRIKQHGDMLARRETELRVLVDSLADAMIQVDADGVVLSANPAVQRILGYAPQDLIGHSAALLLPDLQPGPADCIEPARRPRIFGTGGEVAGRHKDGRQIPLELTASEYRLGGETRYLGILRDISERKRVMAELEQARDAAQAANRAKSAFLATMSHEIRTPMNGVIATVEVLRQASLQPYQAELVDIIRESAFSLLSVIGDILDFSKIEAGRLELEHQPLSPAQVVESACDALQPMVARKNVELVVFVDPALPEWILGDAVRLRQILNNLLGNAIKFSAGREQRATVRVRAERQDAGTLRLTVADNGIGMARDTLDKLFTAFTQAEASTARRYGGTGLGLAICRRLVDLLNGTIAVTSVLGQGSTFTVTLPVEPAEGPPAKAMPSLAGLACVVASTDRDRASDWRVYLQSAGATVATAEDARGRQTRGSVPQDAEMLVAITDSAGTQTDLPALRAAFAGGPLPVHHVLVTRGRQRPRRTDQDVISVGGDGLYRSTLVHAVALAAGRVAEHPVADLDLDASLPAAVAPPSPEEARAQGRLILIAEDNDVNQKVILYQLAHLGYTGEVAEDGRQALALWRTGRHGLLLTDAHMPEMDGYELTAAIRREEAGAARLPIIALTADASPQEDAHCRQAGMDDYLSKPVPLNALKAMLEKWLPAAQESPASAPDHQNAMGGHAAAVLDVGVLRGLVGDDPRVLRGLLADFVALAKRLTGNLGAASVAGDAGQVAAVAHKFKSSARSVGALELGRLCAELERAGRARDTAAIAQPMAALRVSLAAVEAAIKEALKRL